MPEKKEYGEWMKTEEVAEYLGMHHQSIMQFVRRGKLPGPVELGHRTKLWSKSVLDAHLLAERAKAQKKWDEFAWVEGVEGL